MSETHNEWSRELVALIGREVQRLRKDNTRKLTAQQLADLVTELGTPMTRTTVSDLENGRRGAYLTVPELISLARALDIPPGLLTFPGYPDREHQLGADGAHATSEHILRWVNGHTIGPGLPRQRDKTGAVTYWDQSGKWRELVALVEQRHKEVSDLAYLVDDLAAGAAADNLPTDLRVALHHLSMSAASAREHLEDLNSRIRAAGGHVEGDDGEG